MLFKKKAEVYPGGVIFPVDIKTSVSFNGMVFQDIQKKGENIYLSTRTGHVYSIQAEDLSVTWVYKAPEPLVSSPYISMENIFVIGEKHVLYCLDTAGELIWSQKLQGPVTSNVLETEDGVFVGTEDGDIYVMDRNDGRVIRKISMKSAVSSNILSYERSIIFGCADGNLYVMDSTGKLCGSFNAGTKIGSNLSIDGSRLYFFSDDFLSFCLDLKTFRRKWKTSLGEKVQVPPVVYKKKLLVVCWNGVLYCLDKRNGTIKWWRKIPSRSTYGLAVVDKKVIVSSLSSALACFDIESGEQQGYYEAASEIKTNPLWNEPYILVGLYNMKAEEGRLVSLKKTVSVTLAPSILSPQKTEEEIVLTAVAIGFFKPEYEFYVKSGSKKEIVQEKSEKTQWAWYPEKVGEYIIGVVVTDEREKEETKIEFFIKEILFTEKEIAAFLKIWPDFNFQFLKIPWYLIYPRQEVEH
jgi:outer membrane protein assembly factor BamB